ncbi:hypothetical protein HPB51_001541 [Rhipicephalus microplus]|uniref:Uncharacterized protein n=1 Tax=Rhipicephalus microplus TaxID=6941 RepID=A0A9J6EVR6_RHIMP|nr:hypothetical protein HPB51_001541 [Rhipicephalus microplus]
MIMPHREVANCVRQAPARRKSALKSSTQEREEPVSTVQAVGHLSVLLLCLAALGVSCYGFYLYYLLPLLGPPSQEARYYQAVSLNQVSGSLADLVSWLPALWTALTRVPAAQSVRGLSGLVIYRPAAPPSPPPPPPHHGQGSVTAQGTPVTTDLAAAATVITASRTVRVRRVT